MHGVHRIPIEQDLSLRGSQGFQYDSITLFLDVTCRGRLWPLGDSEPFVEPEFLPRNGTCVTKAKELALLSGNYLYRVYLATEWQGNDNLGLPNHKYLYLCFYLFACSVVSSGRRHRCQV